jgi:ankyrin repeat protein
MTDDKPSLFSPQAGKRGMTPLHYAAYAGDLPGLQEALRSGADPNQVDAYRGYTALHWVADMAAIGGPRIEMLHALVAHGADLSLKATTQETAIMLARESGSVLGDQLAAELLLLGATE